MSQVEWSRVDRYLNRELALEDPVLDAVLAANKRAGLPDIDVSPAQGKLLYLLAKAIGARRILEIGTLGGYSTIWLARALPEGGRVITLEFDARHARVAEANIKNAGLATSVDVRVGPALEALPRIEAEGIAPFDLVFIDADKDNNANYLAWALKLARPGTVIIADNVVREGEIANPANTGAGVAGTRALFDLARNDARLGATAIQTVGTKGWDGFAMILVEDGVK